MRIDPVDSRYVLSRNVVLGGTRPAMPRWQRAAFLFLARNALGAERFFRLPPNRVVEFGIQVEV